MRSDLAHHAEYLATILLLLLSSTHTLTTYACLYHVRAKVRSALHYGSVWLYTFCDLALHTLLLAAFAEAVLPQRGWWYVGVLGLAMRFSCALLMRFSQWHVLGLQKREEVVEAGGGEA